MRGRAGGGTWQALQCLKQPFPFRKEASLANQSNANINKEINTACQPKLCIDLVVKSHASQASVLSLDYLPRVTEKHTDD